MTTTIREKIQELQNQINALKAQLPKTTTPRTDAVVTLKDAFALIEDRKRLERELVGVSEELELARAVVAAARLTMKRGGLNTYGLALGLAEHVEAYDERYPEEGSR